MTAGDDGRRVTAGDDRRGLTASPGGLSRRFAGRFSVRQAALLLSAPVLALLVAFALSSLVLALDGDPVLSTYRQMYDYGTTGAVLSQVANTGTTYFLSGLAVAVGFRMALFNIGVEGQYQIAALLAAGVGYAVHLPAPLHLGLIVLTAVLVGALWAGIAGVLRATRGVSEVISTIMLNYVATSALIPFLLNGPLRHRIPGQPEAATGAIPTSGHMPSVDPLLRLVGLGPPSGSSVTGFLLVAVVLGVAVQLVLSRTRFGFDLRATGTNPSAAVASGVNTKRMVVQTMLLSGALAGLVVLPRLLSEQPYRYGSNIPTQIGFTGIAVALVGRNTPLGIAVASVLFAFLDRSSPILELNNVPPEIVTIMQGTIVLAVVVAYEVVRRLRLRQAEREVSRALASGLGSPAGAAA